MSTTTSIRRKTRMVHSRCCAPPALLLVSSFLFHSFSCSTAAFQITNEHKRDIWKWHSCTQYPGGGVQQQRHWKHLRYLTTHHDNHSDGDVGSTNNNNNYREKRRKVEQILRAAIEAVDPTRAVQEFVRQNLQTQPDGSVRYTGKERNQNSTAQQDFSHIQILAFGKASASMATAVVDELKPVIPCSGVVIVKDEHVTDNQREVLESYSLRVREASHPVPDERSVEASREILELVATNAVKPNVLTLCLISGGGSALFCTPHSSLSLQDLQDTNRALLKSGLGIRDINVVRQQLEVGKGGGLAKAVLKESNTNVLISLILSDVLGDPLDLIASGPTVAGQGNFKKAWGVVQKMANKDDIPHSVMNYLKSGMSSEDITLTANPKEVLGDRSKNALVGNNELAVRAAAEKAKEFGYNPFILSTKMEGEAKEVARFYVSLAEHLSLGGRYNIGKLPAAFIIGGETTVTISPASIGKGGRNQELALAAALALNEKGLGNVILGSVGTDGTDGPTDAAGGIVDSNTVTKLGGDAFAYLHNHDGYTYLSQEDHNGESPILKTGPTGTNVADVCVLLID